MRVSAREIAPRASCACACESFRSSRASGCRQEVWKGAQPPSGDVARRRRRVVHTCSPSYHVPSPALRGCASKAISSSEQRARSLNIARRMCARPSPFCQLRTRLKANAAALRLSRREPSSRGLRNNPRPPSLRRRRVTAARCVQTCSPSHTTPPYPPPPPLPPSEGQALHVTASTQTPRKTYSRLRTPQTFKPKPYHRRARRLGGGSRRRARPTLHQNTFISALSSQNECSVPYVISNVSSS